VPIVYDNEVLGIVLLQDKKKNAFSEYDAEIIYNLAAQSGIAIKNAKLFAEIKKLATIDDLTRLNNRRHFFELAEREFKLFKRYNNLESLSMIMLDVDDFKKVNDTYGHYMGDDVLRTVAEKCTETLRETDIIGRYGGEEYVVLLPYAGKQESQKVAERLKKNISEQPIIFNGISIYVTVSIGIAVLEDSINTLEELLKKADIALYEAKKKGKNRIVVI
jgi:diguanylate cyclase (GGDEF)-like protein